MIYFDNAATSQKPKQVIDAVCDYYKKHNANVHRSMNELAERATKMYEDSRQKTAKFINVNPKEIIFTRNTTESLNLIVKTWGKQNLKKGDKVVISVVEHHANIVPWLQLQKEIDFKIDYIPLNTKGVLDIKLAEKLIKNKKTKVVSIQHVSNTLGIVHPINKIGKLAKKSKTLFIVDAAQSVSHTKANVKTIGCDFLVFSGHKMYGPTGIGVLWGKKELLEKMPDWQGGGEMIHEVFENKYSVADIPHKFEAGTPNVAGAIGLGAAIDFINAIGYKNIQKIEKILTDYLFKQVSKLDFVTVYGSKSTANHIPTIAFNVEGVHAHDVAELLGNKSIYIRAGHHCTQVLHDDMKVVATARASLAFYNTKQEIDVFVRELNNIYETFC